MFAYFKGQHEAGFRQHVRSRLRECARAVACVALLAVLPAGAASVTDYTHTDRLIVRLKGQSAADTARASPMTQSDRYRRLADRLESLTVEPITPVRVMGDGAQVIKLNRRLPLDQVRQIAARLANDPDVLEVIPDRLAFPQLTPNDPQFANQWALGATQGVNAPGAWDLTTGDPNLVIAIIDTGRLNHADLAGRWVAGYDFVADTNRSNDSDGRDSDALDPGDWVTTAEAGSGPLMGCNETNSRWHGTAMAGLIGATGNNASGIAGLNWNSKLLPVRVVGKCGGYTSDIVDGMRWAAGLSVPGVPVNPNPAKVLNVSLAALGACDSVYQSAIDAVINAGATVVTAAGNNGGSAANYSPGNCTGQITVGATDRNGGLPTYANTGAAVAISAPGGVGSGIDGILSTQDSGTTVAVNDSIYAAGNGTSISAAQVSGIASLMLSLKPVLLPAEVKTLLTATAKPFSTTGNVTNCNVSICGAGIADASTALTATRNVGPPVPLVVSGQMNAGVRSDGQVFEWQQNFGLVQRTDVGSVRRLARGAGHVLALRTDGTIMAWGANSAGQLGNGTTTSTTIATPVTGFTHVAEVAAGNSHSVAAKIDGTLWVWGYNDQGQLGDGTFATRLSPTLLPSPAGVTRVASASLAYHTLALKSDGTVWAWGANAEGQIGNGTTSVQLTPLAVAGLTDVVAIAAGQYHSLALKNDGTVWTWGQNFYGQLGDGTNTRRTAPVAVTGLANVVAIAGGYTFSLALKSDGTVWAWGYNANGQLGDGSLVNRSTPVQMSGISAATGIAGGANSLVLKADGSVEVAGVSSPFTATMAGLGGVGTLNLNLRAMTFTPQINRTLSSVVNSNTIVLSGIANGSAISVVGGSYQIDAGGFATAAGTVNDGQLLTLRQTASANCGTTTTVTVTIAGVPRGFDVTTVACDITPDPVADFYGQAGVPVNSVRTAGSQSITGINGPTPISIAGGTYSIGCGMTYTAATGTINNGQNVCVRQTAAATPDTLTTATLTIGPLNIPFRVITAVAPAFFSPPSIMMGGMYGGLRSDGQVYEWQQNGSPPSLRTDISGVIRLAEGFKHAIALRADGVPWTWSISTGGNSDGQLGNGSTTDSLTAIPVPGMDNVVSIAAGIYHSLAVKSDGTVWAWGQNFSGQLGDGTTTGKKVPVQVTGVTTATRVASGGGNGRFSLALLASGAVMGWGENQFGTLGDGTNINRSTPMAVSGITNAVAISASTLHSLALLADGTVKAWGYNFTGQLGDGTNVARNVPVTVLGLSGVIAIAAGDQHSLALKSDGTVWAWGANDSGQLGDGSTTNRSTPVPMTGIANATAIGAGADSLVILANGSTFMAGKNQTVPVMIQASGGGAFVLDLRPMVFVPQFNRPLSSTQLSNLIVLSGIANGSAISVTGGSYRIDAGVFTSTPGTINDGQSVTLQQTTSANCGTTTTVTVTIAGVARGFDATTIACDTAPDPISDFVNQAHVPPGSVRTSNNISITGINGPTPVSVTGGEYSVGCTATFTAAAGTINNNQTVCVRQTASASADTVTTTLLTVGTLSAAFRVITAPAPGIYSTPAVIAGSPNGGVRSDGVVFDWFGLSNAAQRTDISGVRQLARSSHSLALRADGTVWAWPFNNSGQLGNGTTVGSTYAIPVPGLTNVASVAAGAGFSLAAKTDGTLWAWGFNDDGQLGDGTTTQRLTPVLVPGLSGVVRIASSNLHSLAVTSGGQAWAWGKNDYGQLGSGSMNSQSTPIAIAGLGNVVAIAAGQFHSLAVKSDGTVWAWGYNATGQLGDGTTTDRVTPVAVPGLVNVVAVAAGNQHSLAMKSDGTVWGWGYNAFGQLGDGTTVTRTTPVQMSGISTATSIAAGSLSLILRADGSVMLSGYNSTVLQPMPMLGVGGVGTLNLDLRVLAFTPQFNLALSSVVQSNAIVLSGIANGSAISVTGGTYKIDAGAFTAAAGTINDGQSVTLRQTASANCSTTTTVTVTIDGVARGFDVTTIPCDTSPDPISDFLGQGNVPVNSVRVSNSISITGINGATPVSITGGEFSVGCTGTFTTMSGSVNNGQSICVRQTASSLADTVTTAQLTVGPLTALFRVITAPAPGFTTTPMVASIGSSGSNAGLRSDGQVFIWETYGTPSMRTDISAVRRVAVGGGHYLALRADGTVWAWGSNGAGQLGLGTTFSISATSVQVPGLTSVAEIAAAGGNSMAVKSDGTLWAWGDNSWGQVGDGSTTRRLSPVQVSGLTGVTRITSGGFGERSMALRADGTVWAWGLNNSGQVGDGTITTRLVPTLVVGLANVVAIAGGNNHSLALKSDGTVAAWGDNTYGQLGDGTGVRRLTAVPVPGLGNVVALAAGQYHTLALKSDGTVWAWGDNGQGQLGDGTTTTRFAPVQMTGVTTGIAITASSYYSQVLRADGTIFYVGSTLAMPRTIADVGGSGALNLIQAGLRPDPFTFASQFGVPLSSQIVSNAITVTGLGTASPITITGGEVSINGGTYTSAPGFVSNNDTVRVRLMSSAGYEALTTASVTIGGAIGSSASFLVYTRRDPNKPASTPAAALGDSSSLVLNGKGNVFSFGYNGNGQLGNGSNFSTSVPTAVPVVGSVVDISTSANHTLVSRTDGTVQAWGFNNAGQLGIGSAQPSVATATFIPGLNFVTAVAAGGSHSLALKADGTLSSWGLNADGQLGDGNTVFGRSTPAMISGLANVIAIAAGGRHSMALLSNGNLLVWGANDAGQLGDGTTVNRLSPTLSTLTNVVAIAAGGAHSLAIRNDGSVWAWGANGFGQLGIGSTANSLVPVQVTSLGTGVGLIAAGESHSLAVKAGGTLFSWGANVNGQLGDGASMVLTLPYRLTTPARVVSISAGGRHSSAINARGELFVWGDNLFGQIGNKSGNYVQPMGAVNILQGSSQISTYANPAGSSTGTSSSSGSAVIEIAGLATGFDFDTVNVGASTSVSGRFKNQHLIDPITSVALGATGPGFGLSTTDCAATLNAGVECGFTLTFSPTSAGDAEGEFQVASSLVGAPERRALYGSGIPAAQPALKVVATANDAYLSFAPQTLGTTSLAVPVTITNTGSATLIVSSAAITTGATDFAAAGSCTNVAPAASCNLQVTFAPSLAAVRDGQLTINTNAGNRVVTLSGAGVAALVIRPPDAPSIAGAIAGASQVTISFTAPANDGGAAITAYEVLCNPGAITQVTATVAPVTITGLGANQSVTCYVTATNSAGTSNASAGVTVTPSAYAIASVKSKKVHASAGPFEVDIDPTRLISQAVSVEPRAIGTSHVLQVEFAQPITTFSGVTAKDAVGADVGNVSASISGTGVEVRLTNIADGQRLTISIAGLNGTAASGSAAMGFLIGDINSSGRVAASDISAIKARIGQTLNANTARYDINLSGTITNQDVSMMKARAGNTLP